MPSTGRLRPLGLESVSIDDGFWAQRQRVNAGATLDHIGRWLEREGWLTNFDLAADDADMTGRRGREFSDSEVYKYLEAIAWELARRPDDRLEARFASIVDRVAAAQEPDGYLGTRFGRRGQAARYSDLEWGHELYCQGHLLQAAVARVRTGHLDDLLVQVAARSAAHICETFGPDGLPGICGHPEIEVALAELGRALGERRFVDQAKLFVDRRGHQLLADIEFGRSYYQDDLPVRDAEVFRGHAVRANYLAAGAIDVAVETGEPELLHAIERQWSRTVARRTYVTGGQGSRHQDEGYGDDFMLPPDRAYSETCASVASIMVSWRLLLQTGDYRHADLIERTLFNVMATSPGEDGESFFYSNTLHQRSPGEVADPEVASARAESSLRAPWFDVSCCPPNVARTLASLAALCASVDPDGVQIHQYAPMTVSTSLSDGSPLALRVTTAFPDDGRITVTVLTAPERSWTLQLRIPDWCSSATLTQPGAAPRPASAGVASITGLAAGESVVLDLDMAARFVWPDERIDAVRGTVAIRRGPEILALESCDLPSHLGPDDLSRLRLDTSREPIESDGRVTVRAEVRPEPADAPWPYRDDEPVRDVAPVYVEVPLVAYHDWARRGPSTMRVWIPAR